MEDDGEVDGTANTLFGPRVAAWYPQSSPTVAQAFSDVGKHYMFQAVPHVAMDTTASVSRCPQPTDHPHQGSLQGRENLPDSFPPPFFPPARPIEAERLREGAADDNQ